MIGSISGGMRADRNANVSRSALSSSSGRFQWLDGIAKQIADRSALRGCPRQLGFKARDPAVVATAAFARRPYQTEIAGRRFRLPGLADVREHIAKRRVSSNPIIAEHRELEPGRVIPVVRSSGRDPT